MHYLTSYQTSIHFVFSFEVYSHNKRPQSPHKICQILCNLLKTMIFHHKYISSSCTYVSRALTFIFYNPTFIFIDLKKLLTYLHFFLLSFIFNTPTFFHNILIFFHSIPTFLRLQTRFS